MTVSNRRGWILIMIGVLKMNKADINYIIEKLDSYKPDNVYDGYNSEKEKQDQRVSEVLDSIISEIESDYESGNTPMPKEWGLNCKLDKEQMEELKRKICFYTNLEPVEENQWIKCSDRMPEEGKEVLLVMKTWGKNKEMHIGFFDSKMKWWQAGSGVIKNEYVTHWMPLPSTEGLDDAT